MQCNAWLFTVISYEFTANNFTPLTIVFGKVHDEESKPM
jgi:hypothetical protein